MEWTYLHACSYSDSLKITEIVEIVAGWQKRSKYENSGLLPEVVLSTEFVKSEIRKVQLEARDIPLHAGIFRMSISIYVFLQWHFENNQTRWNRRRVTKTLKIQIFNCSKSRHFRCLETLKNTVHCTTVSIYILKNQISAISYRFAEMELTKITAVVVVVVVFGFLYPWVWPATCLSRERSSTIARNFGYV